MIKSITGLIYRLTNSPTILLFSQDCGDNPPPLYGLVNNAGVAEGDMATILGTNLFGVKAAVDAFLPLIDQSQGRIVQVRH